MSSYTPLPACRCGGGQLNTQERQIPRASVNGSGCLLVRRHTQQPHTDGNNKQPIPAKGGLPQPARTLQSPSPFAQKVTMHLLGSSDRTHIHMGESSLSCMLHGSASSPQQSLRHAAPRTSPHTPARPSGDVPVCLAGAVVVVVTARVVVVVVAMTAVVLALVVAVCLAGAVVPLALHASAGRCRHHHTEANESKRDVLSQHRPPATRTQQ